MSGIYFLLFLIGVAVVAVWYVRNDELGPGAPGRGILRMKDEASPAQDER